MNKEQRISNLEEVIETMAEHIDTLAWLHAEQAYRTATVVKIAVASALAAQVKRAALRVGS